MFVWKIEFVYNTNRDAQKSINVIASSFTDAVTTAQINLPNAEITALNKVGKITELYTPDWVEAVAKYFIKHGTVSDIQVFSQLCGDQMREELTAKIWELHHNGRTN